MDGVRARLRKALLKIDGLIESPGIFGDGDGDGDGFWVNGKQIGSWRDEHDFQLRLTRPVIRALRDRLRSDGRVTLRGSSDWVTLTMGSTRDVPFTLELAELAAAAHRAPEGVAAKPPPTGAELDRRRRFH